MLWMGQDEHLEMWMGLRDAWIAGKKGWRVAAHMEMQKGLSIAGSPTPE